MQVVDTLGRPLRALRISVTDRCNFRCRYCMPREVFGPDYAYLDRSALLSFEEITRLVRIATGLGIAKVRLTGGEPLLRRELPTLVRMLAAVPGLQDLALTTNGALLGELAPALRAAGLKRLTVSLDTLRPDRFQSLSDTDLPLDKVLSGLEAARAAGFGPIKLNCVLQRGVNEDEILDLAAFAREQGHTLRFIEFMDVGTTNGWKLDSVVPAAEIRGILQARWPLEPLPVAPGQVARDWRYRDGRGEVGLIASVTAPFCRDCDRARLSADGHLYTCLFAATGLDLKGCLRVGHSDADLTALLSAHWGRREDRYSELRRENTQGLPRIEMSHIGG
ncbi:MAG: GTP 3',8-cyclase MoaA [Holophagaceae bacterium]|uniref:GTP 3',8-cyclase n=1 Tax=Candidatus Geothrix skivensis TaxID=2954439 RepID=A0A9D7SIV5_9BACT|nr:GTP 3',8-cyclase MoaA [Candidatus Geothrix skivensis]